MARAPANAPQVTLRRGLAQGAALTIALVGEFVGGRALALGALEDDLRGDDGAGDECGRSAATAAGARDAEDAPVDMSSAAEVCAYTGARSGAGAEAGTGTGAGAGAEAEAEAEAEGEGEGEGELPPEEVERRIAVAANTIATSESLLPYDPRQVNLALVVW